jgi:long-chain fatty acid adenylase/transferase FadD26
MSSLSQETGWLEEEALHRLRTVKREVTSAIKKSHSLRVADLILVPPGSIPLDQREGAAFGLRRAVRQDEFLRLEVTA